MSLRVVREIAVHKGTYYTRKTKKVLAINITTLVLCVDVYDDCILEQGAQLTSESLSLSVHYNRSQSI